MFSPQVMCNIQSTTEAEVGYYADLLPSFHFPSLLLLSSHLIPYPSLPFPSLAVPSFPFSSQNDGRNHLHNFFFIKSGEFYLFYCHNTVFSVNFISFSWHNIPWGRGAVLPDWVKKCQLGYFWQLFVPETWLWHFLKKTLAIRHRHSQNLLLGGCTSAFHLQDSRILCRNVLPKQCNITFIRLQTEIPRTLGGGFTCTPCISWLCLCEQVTMLGDLQCLLEELQTSSSSSFEFEFELARSFVILSGSKPSSCPLNIKICIFA